MADFGDHIYRMKLYANNDKKESQIGSNLELWLYRVPLQIWIAINW